MQVTFFGAVREVTGSMHLLSTNSDRILMDCGLFQGKRKENEAKNRLLPFDTNMLTNVILSHAHIDHSGRIPLLAKHDFNGRIICTRATAAACEYLLPDAAHIQESDAAYLNYKTLRGVLGKMKPDRLKKIGMPADTAKVKKLLKKNRHKLDSETIDRLTASLNLEKVEPLYTNEEAMEALQSFDDVPYQHPVDIGKDITCTFYDAGHILGSAISIIKVHENGQNKTICYTGDIGRFSKPIINDPTLEFAPEDCNVDLMIMESTYGNRDHEPVEDLKPFLKKVLTETANRGGSVLIPAFAFGRTQELLYMLHELYTTGEVERLPVYVDSPLATKLTRVFGEHPEVYDEETHDTFLENGLNPFFFKQINFVTSVEESIALTQDKTPHIVLSASGMCESGRILHHLRHKIHDSDNTILIVGFMAQNTLGRRILDRGMEYEASGRTGDPPLLRFLNKEYPLKARVVKTGGFSAHGDRNEMMRFLKDSNLNVKKIAVVHGEEDQALAFAGYLQDQGFSAGVPEKNETWTV